MTLISRKRAATEQRRSTASLIAAGHAAVASELARPGAPPDPIMEAIAAWHLADRVFRESQRDDDRAALEEAGWHIVHTDPTTLFGLAALLGMLHTALEQHSGSSWFRQMLGSARSAALTFAAKAKAERTRGLPP
jgi:hypothetical protein